MKSSRRTTKCGEVELRGCPSMAHYKKFDAYSADTDPRVPTWDGRDHAPGLERFFREARGFIAGLQDDDQKTAPPRLWSNLRGEAKLAVPDLDPADLRDEGGIFVAGVEGCLAAGALEDRG